jgi:hypothetical protein
VEGEHFLPEHSCSHAKLQHFYEVQRRGVFLLSVQDPQAVLYVLAELVDLQVVDHFEDLLQVARAACFKLAPVQGPQNEDCPMFVEVGKVGLR